MKEMKDLFSSTKLLSMQKKADKSEIPALYLMATLSLKYQTANPPMQASLSTSALAKPALSA